METLNLYALAMGRVCGPSYLFWDWGTGGEIASWDNFRDLSDIPSLVAGFKTIKNQSNQCILKLVFSLGSDLWWPKVKSLKFCVVLHVILGGAPLSHEGNVEMKCHSFIAFHCYFVGQL